MQNADIQNLITLSKKFKLDLQIIKLLFARGIDTQDKIKKFLNPSLNDFHNPFDLTNMQEIVDTIKFHLSNNSNITILGDYDADGISATCILYKYFESQGKKVDTFLPNRIADGYGLTNDTIDKIKLNYNPDLIITVDCGISSFNEVAYCKSLGIDIIITDHHDIPDIIPECLILNPKLKNQQYKFKELCGAGVAFKLVQALIGLKDSINYTTIASIATVADLVPLVDENRAIVYYGLKTQQSNLPLGVLKLAKKLNLSFPLTSNDISFKLAPKINASGRMGDANISLQIFIDSNEDSLNSNIEKLLEMNNKRLVETNLIFEDSLDLLKKSNISNMGIIILYNQNWESGVLGIICSKLVEIYNRPVCLLTKIDNELKGSIRSVKGIDIYSALNELKDLLIRFGGHNQAGGLTILEKNLASFKRKFNELILSKYGLDNFIDENKYDIEMKDIKNLKIFLTEISRLEPFGFGNEKPIYKLNFNASKVSFLPNFPQHLKIYANKTNLIAFNMSDKYYSLLSNSNKTALLDMYLDTFSNKQYIKGIVRNIYFDKINTTIKPETICANYILQLKHFHSKLISTKKIQPIKRELIKEKILSFLGDSPFGTLVVANTFESYKNFTDLKLPITNFELFNITNNSGINTVVFSPSNLDNFKNYTNIIFLDTPLCEGYVNELLKINDIYIVEGCINMNIFKNLSSSRTTFGNYHNAIKSFCTDNSIQYLNGNLIESFNNFKKSNFKNIKFKYDQFIYVLLVLGELEILKFENNNLIFNSKKNNLENSSIYNFLNLLLNIRGVNG